MKCKNIVIVSHSEKFAEGIKELINIADSDITVATAGGLEDGSLGTSYEKIKSAIEEVYSDAGVIILTDMGSSVMTSEMVVEDFDAEIRKNISICDYHTAEKIMDIISEVHNCGTGEQNSNQTQNVASWEYIIKDSVGLHARPAAAIVKLARNLNDRITLENESGVSASGNSITEIMSLGIKQGEKIIFHIEGSTAEQSIDELKNLIKEII